MVDFNKLLKEMKNPEYQQRKKEREEKERLKEELIKHTACFTGHRPQATCMFGFDMKHFGYDPLKESLTKSIELCIQYEDINRFISGGAQGVDQIAFWCIHKLKTIFPDIKNIVAVPFKDQPLAWKDKKAVKWYFKMLEKADEIVYVDELDDFRYKVNEIAIGNYHIEKMSRRNEYMVNNSRILIAVFDSSKGGTRNCYSYAQKESKTIFRIDPRNNFELDVKYGMYD